MLFRSLQVGLLGMGIVGCGTWTVLKRNEEEISRRAGRPIRITWIATRTLERAQKATRGAKDNSRERRDVLVKGLHEAGWLVDIPKASMYVWAKIPDAYKALGSLEFTKKLISQAKVSVSPGIGFGEFGDEHVRFAMIENESRTRASRATCRDRKSVV